MAGRFWSQGRGAKRTITSFCLLNGFLNKSFGKCCFVYSDVNSTVYLLKPQVPWHLLISTFAAILGIWISANNSRKSPWIPRNYPIPPPFRIPVQPLQLQNCWYGVYRWDLPTICSSTDYDNVTWNATSKCSRLRLTRSTSHFLRLEASWRQRPTYQHPRFQQ